MISLEECSSFCFGCEPLGGTDWGDVDIAEIEKAIRQSLELGANFFDTAAVYGLGLSEERLSAILGEKRHDVVIATKGGLSWNQDHATRRATVIRDSSPSAIQYDIEASLSRLKLDCLPIFYVHWPDSNVSIAETFDALMKIRDEGKIGAIGCSNFDADQIKQACSVSDVRFVQMPHNLLMSPIDDEIYQLCDTHDIKIVLYNVLANGLLTGKYDRNSIFPENDRRSRLPLFQGAQYKKVLNQIEKIRVSANSEEVTLAQYSIQSVLSLPYVYSVILGIKNNRQLVENFSATQ